MKRNTVQRQIILDTLKALDTHPTAEDLHKEIQKKYPSIGIATVYRNLRQLTESGLVLQIATLDGVARYDGCADPHYHFHCKTCGGAFDLELNLIDGIEEAVESKYGFQVDSHEVTFTGTCTKCI
ncbi:MAG: transcriptional repressor [Defluviitaleaceae bacterium]|nr:transcriptional repressor [Defluviitaleaceae bacterium]